MRVTAAVASSRTKNAQQLLPVVQAWHHTICPVRGAHGATYCPVRTQASPGSLSGAPGHRQGPVRVRDPGTLLSGVP